jgi:hypothetical protein
MAQVAQVRTSPASVEAQTWAPQAHAHALELERRAEKALTQGDATAAELSAEHAIAAHEHAFALTRVARAERRRLDADAELLEQRRLLAELHTQHQRLTAEAAGLELQAQVVKGALPLPPHEVAAPERQQARRRAASALLTQSRLLCVAARLLGDVDGVRVPMTRLDQLELDLAKGSEPRLLETATELRSECLRLISDLRRQHTSSAAGDVVVKASLPQSEPSPPASDGSPSPGPATAPRSGSAAHAPSIPADSLLEELSVAGVAPSRDERGVSVVLRDLFDAGGQLTTAGRTQLQPLVQVAKAHPDFPLLVVAHTGSPQAGHEAERKLAALRSELGSAGLRRVETHDAGQRQPLLPPQAVSARARNERIELVFVAPGL